MPVKVEITNEWYEHAVIVEALPDFWYGFGGLWGVHGDAHNFTACSSEIGHLLRGGERVFGVSVRHRLHHDRMV